MADEQQLLEELRPAAFGVAYRMLGTVSDAEDIVQEALLRFHQALERGEEISSPRAYVATVVTRLAIDQLRSARVKRETYVGEWLPEPLLTTDPEDDPARRAETADELSLAFLVVLEQLTPEQRAAFLLHDAFDYGYGEIAEIVGTSEENARQLASRARRYVLRERPRFEPSAEQRDRLADRFFAALEGDVGELEALLADDVELHGDGGGKAPALARVLRGRVRAARTLANWMKVATRAGGFRVEREEVNGQPGARFLTPEGELISVLVLDIADGRIQTIRSVVNPDKLGHLGPVANLGEMLRRASRG